MSLILKVACPDRPGIVKAIATLLSDQVCNIVDSSQFFQPDPGTDRSLGQGRFFLRMEVVAPEGYGPSALIAALEGFKATFEADVQVHEGRKPLKTIVMVSKFDHCMQDIFYRVKTGTLALDIVAVVSNHAATRPDVERLGIPFHLWPVTPDTKAEQEARLDELINRSGAELIVLARYMQVLSDGFSTRHFGKIINIHHSFLPAFKGAKPYHRAYERGVKMIGATAHYVTADLDEGPIIDQDAQRVSHALSAEELVLRGRETEARVLSRALFLHSDHRVFLNGHRTVVFEP